LRIGINGNRGQGVNVLVLEPSGHFAVGRQAADLNHPDLIGNQSAHFVDTHDHSVHATAVGKQEGFNPIRPGTSTDVKDL